MPKAPLPYNLTCALRQRNMAQMKEQADSDQRGEGREFQGIRVKGLQEQL